MIITTILTSQIRDGQLVNSLAVRFRVTRQHVELLEGDPRFIQLGLPVYSETYGGLIDFDTDGEEWARNLPDAYRNGAICATSEAVAETKRPSRRAPAVARAAAAMRRYA